MRVIATPEARAYIASRGGIAYVRPLQRRCCGGALTVLSATTTAPADASLYEAVGDPLLGVRYRRPGPVTARALASAAAPAAAGSAAPSPADGGSAARSPADGAEAGPAVHRAEPAELLIEVRGRRRPRLFACWDGCAFKI
ncbi:MAG: hypothetical protein ABSB54_00895 [Acidimicrobiales bacterium]|jgi:hypothetical protein